MNKLEFNTVLEQSDKVVKVIVDEFVQYDPMVREDTGYVNYRVFIDDIDITENLSTEEDIQLKNEAYEYCVDQIGITDDEEIEELDFDMY